MKTIRRHRHHFGPALILGLVLLAVGGEVVHHMVTVAVAAGFVAAGSLALAWRWQRRRTRHQVRGRVRATFHGMNPTEFEHALAALCQRDGCRHVQVVGGAGDLGADVIATTPDGKRIVIQAKRYAPGNNVGSPEVQKVGGTYSIVHKAHRAAVVTTSGYTADAVKYARMAGIRLFAEPELAAWASRTGPAPWQ